MTDLALRKQSVLVVDDHEDLRRVLGRGLSSLGYEVFTAANGADALELTDANAIDAVVTDVHMPEMDGLELIRELRGTHPALRIIAMSGGGSLPADLALEVCQLSGADALLHKPMTAAAVDKLLRSILLAQGEEQ